MIKESPEQISQRGQEELYFSLEGRSSQRRKDRASIRQYSHEELWELYQAVKR